MERLWSGAFTGAAQGPRWPHCQAHGGTLFLDEDRRRHAAQPASPPAARMLRSGGITPLGAQRARTVDIAVVRHHRDLRQAVADGATWGRSIYRLAGVRVRLPALREHERPRELCQRLLLEESRRSRGMTQRFANGWTPTPGRAICASCAACCAGAHRSANTRTTRWTSPPGRRRRPPRCTSPAGPRRLADIEQRAILHALAPAPAICPPPPPLGVAGPRCWPLRGAAATGSPTPPACFTAVYPYADSIAPRPENRRPCRVTSLSAHLYRLTRLMIAQN